MWAGQTPGLFCRDSPPPSPPFLPQFLSREPARASVRGRGFPCASSCTSRFVSGGREEDWGSQLFLGHISSGRGPGFCWGDLGRPRPPPPPSLLSAQRSLLPVVFSSAFPPFFPVASGLTSTLHPPGLGPAARSCLPQPPSRGPQPPPTPPHGPGAMSELEQLRQEAEQLRNQIRVRAWPAELWVGD